MALNIAKYVCLRWPQQMSMLPGPAIRDSYKSNMPCVDNVQHFVRHLAMESPRFGTQLSAAVLKSKINITVKTYKLSVVFKPEGVIWSCIRMLGLVHTNEKRPFFEDKWPQFVLSVLYLLQ